MIPGTLLRLSLLVALIAAVTAAVVVPTALGAVAAGVDLDEESVAGVRAERSTNLSHIARFGRKIVMYVSNRHLQIMPDGVVNGTDNDNSDYAILQRISVSMDSVKLQGVATCLFLCMDACGLLFGSRELSDSCIFVEHLADNNYNTYASQKHSTPHRTLFLALDRRGQPRRARWKPPQPLGRLAKYVQVLTKSVDPHRVEELGRRLRHHNHHALCPPATVSTTQSPPHGERCRRGRRPAHGRHRNAPSAPRRHCDPAEDEDVCHKRLQMIAVKKRKSRNEERPHRAHRRKKQHGRPKKTPLSPPPPSSTTPTTAPSRNNQRNNPMQLQVLSPEADEDEEDAEEDLDDEDGEELTTATSASPMPSPAPDA